MLSVLYLGRGFCDLGRKSPIRLVTCIKHCLHEQQTAAVDIGCCCSDVSLRISSCSESTICFLSNYKTTAAYYVRAFWRAIDVTVASVWITKMMKTRDFKGQNVLSKLFSCDIPEWWQTQDESLILSRFSVWESLSFTSKVCCFSAKDSKDLLGLIGLFSKDLLGLKGLFSKDLLGLKGLC